MHIAIVSAQPSSCSSGHQAAAIRDRYKKQVNNSADAVVFLVEEGVVPADQVGDKLKKHLG